MGMEAACVLDCISNQQVEGSGNSALYSTCEAMSGVLCPLLGFPLQKNTGKLK